METYEEEFFQTVQFYFDEEFKNLSMSNVDKQTVQFYLEKYPSHIPSAKNLYICYIPSIQLWSPKRMVFLANEGRAAMVLCES